MPNSEKYPKYRAEQIRMLEMYANEDETVPTIRGVSLDDSDLTDEEKRIFMIALSA